MEEPGKGSASPRVAIGYVRVSTKLQVDKGASLHRQLDRVRHWAELNGYQVNQIFEDVGSAAGRNNLRNRPEFEQAAREAAQAGVPLIVSDMSRLSRDLATLEKLVIERGLTVISVADDGEVPVAVMRSRVAAGAEEAQAGAERTKKALSLAPRSRPQHAETLPQKAAQASAERRSVKRQQVLERVLDCLMRNPELMVATSNVVADHLNQEGIYTGWDRPWTASAVRAQWQALKEEMSFRQQVQDEEINLDQSDRSGRSEEEDEEELRQNPLYGVF